MTHHFGRCAVGTWNFLSDMCELRLSHRLGPPFSPRLVDEPAVEVTEAGGKVSEFVCQDVNQASPDFSPRLGSE